MKYLLDTDVSSYFLRGKFNLITKFEGIGVQNIRISRATVAELEVLAFKNPSSRINFEAINRFAKAVGTLEVNPETWKTFSRIKARMLTQGTPKGDMDVLIASVAKQNGLTVVTNNEKHFESMVEVENWTAS